MLQRLAQQLDAEPDIVIAIVFGSMATGHLHPDSDLDIAILAPEPLDASRRQALIRLVADASGRAVDLVDLRTAGVLLMRSVLCQGRRLVCKDRRAYDLLVSRMLVDTADFLPYRQRIMEERRKAWIQR